MPEPRQKPNSLTNLEAAIECRFELAKRYAVTEESLAEELEISRSTLLSWRGKGIPLRSVRGIHKKESLRKLLKSLNVELNIEDLTLSPENFKTKLPRDILPNVGNILEDLFPSISDRNYDDRLAGEYTVLTIYDETQIQISRCVLRKPSREKPYLSFVEYFFNNKRSKDLQIIVAEGIVFVNDGTIFMFGSYTNNVRLDSYSVILALDRGVARVESAHGIASAVKYTGPAAPRALRTSLYRKERFDHPSGVFPIDELEKLEPWPEISKALYEKNHVYILLGRTP